jgi:hypothetical protein
MHPDAARRPAPAPVLHHDRILSCPAPRRHLHPVLHHDGFLPPVLHRDRHQPFCPAGTCSSQALPDLPVVPESPSDSFFCFSAGRQHIRALTGLSCRSSAPSPSGPFDLIQALLCIY